MMNCPKCTHVLRAEARFCDSCGAPVSSPDVRAAAGGAAQTLRDDPLIGQTLDGKYELLARLGEGGMGAVYRARRVHIGDEVAVKVLPQRFVADAASVERFRREARAAAMLRHPNVVTIYDYGEATSEDAPAYIVMELLEGTSLRHLLEREGRLAPARAAALMRDICAGVGAAHRRGVFHRDLKPDNVIILPPDEDRERESVKVVDFGIAKLRDQTSAPKLTQTGAVIGTPYYMSPEQCRGEPLDAHSDVYSLGAMTYEMLAGTPPFTAETITGVMAKHLFDPPPPLAHALEVPAAVEGVIRRALAKDPDERQPGASELARELQEAERRAREEAEAARRRAEEEERRAQEQRRAAEERAEREAEARRLAEEERRTRAEAERREAEERERREREEAEERHRNEAIAAAAAAAKAAEEQRERRRVAKAIAAARAAEEDNARLREQEERFRELQAGRTSEAEARRTREEVEAPPRRKAAAPAAPPPPVPADQPPQASPQAIPHPALPVGQRRRRAIPRSAVALLVFAVFSAGLSFIWIGSAIFIGREVAPQANTNTGQSPTPAPSPAATPAPVPPEGMVYVPGGPFTMGRDDGDVAERPAHTESAGPFFIDKYEVTREGYYRFRPGNIALQSPRHPVTGLDWDKAEAFCRSQGKRLPTEAEWEFAARGADARRYPWGEEWKAELANAGPGRAGLVDVGTFKGESPFGALDMAGNAWEWTASKMEAYKRGRLPPGLPDGELKVIRGGSYESGEKNATTTYRTGWPARGATTYQQTGFRCAKDITP